MITQLAELNRYIGYTAFIGVEDQEIIEEEKNLYNKMKSHYNPSKLNEFRKACRDVGEDEHINGITVADVQLQQEIFNFI